MLERIHWTRIWNIMDRRDEHGNRIPFSITYVKISTGEKRVIDSCVMTSIHSKGSTLNILPKGEPRPKKIKKCLITMFNNASVYI